MNSLEMIQLGFAQKIFGEYRMGWDIICDGPIPNRFDIRDRIAGLILGRKFFSLN